MDKNTITLLDGLSDERRREWTVTEDERYIRVSSRGRKTEFVFPNPSRLNDDARRLCGFLLNAIETNDPVMFNLYDLVDCGMFEDYGNAVKAFNVMAESLLDVCVSTRERDILEKVILDENACDISTKPFTTFTHIDGNASVALSPFINWNNMKRLLEGALSCNE